MPLTVLSVSYPLAQVSPNTAGGAEQVLAMLDEALVQKGHRSLVLAPAGSHCRGLLVPARIANAGLDEAAKIGARREFGRLLNRTLRDFRVDIVHMHGLDFFEYLPQRETPIVVSLHLPLSWYAPGVLISVPSNVSFVCVSKSQVNTVPPGMRVRRVIANGIEIPKFGPAKKRSSYALVMTRICPEKGIHLAIEAAEKAGVELIIAGTVFDYAEHRAYFDSMVKPRLNESIRFIGPVGGNRKARLLAGARCLLAPSLAPETSSLVAMEAMASGTSVIAFPNGALSEIVTHGRTGFLVSDAREMSEAIDHAGSISTELCRREAETRFSSRRMCNEYFDLYRSQMSARALPEARAAA